MARTPHLPWDDLRAGMLDEASRLLKTMANRDRLMVLCVLAESGRNVSELERLLDIRQPTLSQHLARLRSEELVETRREGKVIHYKLTDRATRQVIELLRELYSTLPAGGDGQDFPESRRDAGS